MPFKSLTKRHIQQGLDRASKSSVATSATTWRTWTSRSTNHIIFLLFSLLLIPFIDASGLRTSTTCGPAKCAGGGKKFHYKPEHVYSYQYVLNGTTSIEGGPSEQSGLHLSSQVAIKFLSACDAVLFLTDVELWQSNQPKDQEEHVFTKASSSSQLSRALQEYPLRFSYADGAIEEICPDPADSTAALNIKRGLLSSFQNTMRRLDLEHKGEETDVHGTCKVEYGLGTATSRSLTLVRSKNIKSCGDKFGVFSSVQGASYNFGTKQQSMPAVSSLSSCEQVVDRNLLSSITCRETHRLKSLSRGVAGAVTTLVQQLDLRSVYKPVVVRNVTLGNNNNNNNNNNGDPMPNPGSSTQAEEGEEDENEEDDSMPRSFQVTTMESLPVNIAQVIRRGAGGETNKIRRRDSMQFENEYHVVVRPTSNDFETAKKALRDFCASVKGEVKQTSGKLFESLVDTLRGLSPPAMMNLTKEAPGLCQGDRAPFDDALEAVGTAASIAVITDKILQRNATTPAATIESWIASFTYIAKPDLALMQSAVPIIKARVAYPQVLLTFSTLAHSYCRTDPKCMSRQPISILTKLYEKYFLLTKCIHKTQRDVDQIIMYLKGIGNFGMLSPGIEQAIHMCVQNNPQMEVRVAAIESYRRMQCGFDGSILEKILLNVEEDSELRINAFLNLMRCPSYATIRLVKTILMKEQVNQVGSFLWTYIKNLQETALPSKAELQGLVADEKLVKKFSTDVRKFSRNFEISTFYDDLNFGLGVDSNIIYSQDSYVPRSSSVNLTVDLFGESINVFEANIRLESFEHYVESVFGPNGKLSSTELYNIVSSFREKRAVPSKRKLRTLSLEYDASRRYYSDPIASLSLKTFGNEILYKRKVGVEEQSELLKSLNPLEYLKRLGDKDTNWQKSTMLLDSSYIIPTGAGLPLNLSAQASSILRLEAMSVIDAGNFPASSELKLKGKLQPSAILSVTGSMALGVSSLRTGIKVRAHVRSSAALEGGFHVRGTKLLNMEFGIPQSKIDVLEYSSELVFMEGNEETVVGSIPAGRKQPICSTKQLLPQLLGLKLCSSSYFHLSPSQEADDPSAPYFPLNGPAHFIVSLEKMNPDLLKSKFIYEFTNNKNITKLKAGYENVMKVSTGSDQVFSLQLDVDKREQDFNFELILPSTVINGSGQLEKDVSKGYVELGVKARPSGNEHFHTKIAFESTRSQEKKILRPSASLTYNMEKILETDCELSLSESPGGTTFQGQGNLLWRGSQRSLEVRGSKNETTVSLVLDSQYKRGAKTETMTWRSSLSRVYQPRTGSGKTEGNINLEFSEYPDTNFGATWKHQKTEDGFDNELEIRQGRGPSWSDRTALKIRQASTYYNSHDGNRLKWLLYVAQPSRQIDWGFEATLNAHGKSLDSAINLRYAPGKNLQTSLSVKRAPGVLTFLQIGWNATLPDQQPLQFTLHLEEKTQRVYEILFDTDWFGTNNVNVAITYNDKSRRNVVNSSLDFAIQTKTTEKLKFFVHFLHHEDKELKLILSSEYGNRISSVEIGHSQGMKGKRHKAYGSLRQGQHVYLVTGEVQTDSGFQCLIKTDFGSKLADIAMSIRSTYQNGMQSFTVDYKWDASRDESKQFLLEFFMDLSREYLRRSELVLTYPGRHLLIGGEHTINPDDESQDVTGRLKWDEKNHVQLNARLAPDPHQTDAFKALVQCQTPFESIKNVSLTVRYNINDERNCHIDIDGSWGDNGRVRGDIASTLTELEEPEEEDEEADDNTEQGEENGDDDETGDARENSIEVEGKKKKENKKASQKPFMWSLKANFSSTVTHLETVRISMLHTQHNPLNVKTDIDIKLPANKEISIGSQWVLPRRLEEILSSRLVFHVKTPFVGYQSMNLQAIVGHQEDSDILAVAGLYLESLQYSVTITGTPRFEEDGALGFEITTSHPKYDKIFGSFNYAIGDSSRFACQLGWPQVVIGLESGLQWDDSEEFQAYFTFSSPWMPLKNVNALAKIDATQAELKLELNEEGINGKCEWLIESFRSSEIHLEVTTPFEEIQKLGFIFKNSLDEEVGIHSQAVAWVNDEKLGYKFEGEKSEEEEEKYLAIVMNAQVEVDLIIYPTVRTTISLVQREAKFSLAGSILLREGPINVSAELDLLDVFRFNEKITITTPFPGLVELEINLNPAIFPSEDPSQSLYNIGVSTRWRSGSDWHEAGLVVRCGDQSILSTALAQDTDEDEEEEEEEEAGEGENEEEEGNKPKPTAPSKLPSSQLYYFYSPLEWAKEIKFEYEPKGNGEEEEESADEEQLPIRTFAIAYHGLNSEIRTDLLNDKALKQILIRVHMPNIPDPISLELDANLDLKDEEKKLELKGISSLGTRQEVSASATWENRTDYLKAWAEVHSPFEDFEVQSGQVMYANNELEEKYTWSLELSNSYLGELDSTILIGRDNFNLQLESPFELLTKLEVRGDLEEGSEDTVNVAVTATSGKEDIQIDVVSLMQDKWPTQISGTMQSSSNRQRQGNVTATIAKTEDQLKATGLIHWGSSREKLTGSLLVKFPENRFQELDVKVDTPVNNGEHWELSIVVPSEERDEEEEEEENEDGEREETERFQVQIKGRTPWANFASLQADGSFEMGSSFLDVKKATASTKTPSGSIDIRTSWTIEEWNNFDIQWNSSYHILLPSTPLPKDNFLKLRIHNKIPTLEYLSRVDSIFYFQTSDVRLGSSVWIEHEESESLTLKLTTSLPQTTQTFDLTTTYDKALGNIVGDLVATHEPPNKRLKSSFQIRTRENSFDGEADAEWGEDDFSSLRSRFNCSYANGDKEVHVELFNPKIMSSPVGAGTTVGDERGVSLILAGSANIRSGLHKARVESGIMAKPVIVVLEVAFPNGAINITSVEPVFNVTEAGLRLQNRFQPNSYEGFCGGHWGEDEASVKYNLEYERVGELLRLDGSLSTKLPFEKAQSAAIEVSYEHEAMNTDGKLRAEWNSEKLIGTHYHFEASSSAGTEKERTKLELDNNLWPFGLITLYQYNYSGGYDGKNLPTATRRGLEVYDLVQPDTNRLGFEVKLDTDFNGRTVTLTGAHPSRKLELITNYEFLDHQFLHTCRFNWSPDSEVGYNLNIVNLTKDGMVEHKGTLKVMYPIREITLSSSYLEQGRSVKITTELNPNSKKSTRTLVGILNLEGGEEQDSRSPNMQLTRKMNFIIRHPSLSQDIRSEGEVHFVRGVSIDGKLSLDYAADARRKLTLVMRAVPELRSDLQWNVTSDLRLQHEATNLDLSAVHNNKHTAQELSFVSTLDLKHKSLEEQKSKFAFELFKQLRKLVITVETPEDQLSVTSDVRGQFPIFDVEAEVRGKGPLCNASLNVDLRKPYYDLRVRHGPALSSGLFSEGGVVDSRNVKWDISESYDGHRYSDISFFLRMNHSKLITSKLKWRPDLLEDLEESYTRTSDNVRNAWSQQSDKLLLALSRQASEVIQQIWEDAKTTIGPFIQEMSDEFDFTNETEEWKLFLNRTIINNDFYAQDLVSFMNLMAEEISVRFSNVFLRLKEYRRKMFGDSSQLFEKTVLWILEKSRENYRQLVAAWQKYRSESQPLSFSLSPLRDQLAQLFYQMVESASQLTEHIYEVCLGYGVRAWSYVDQFVQRYKPAIVDLVHRIEEFGYGILVRVSEFASETRDDLMKTKYYQNLQKFADNLDEIYKDLSQSDAPTNIRKIYTMVKNFLNKKFAEGNFEQQLGDVGNYLTDLWNDFKQLEYVREVISCWNEFSTKAHWLAQYLNVDEAFQDALVAVYTKGGDLIYQTVLEASARYQTAKTKFIFDPDKGVMELEQKLPMPWNAFNQTPNFQELPEYQNILKLQNLFQSSEGSFWDAWYKAKPKTNPVDWFPPFDGHAMMVGSEYFFTFDGLSYNFTGSNCVLLLAGDMVDQNFSVSIQYKGAQRRQGSSSVGYFLVITASHNTIFMDFDESAIKVAKRGVITSTMLPVQLQHLQAYKDGNQLVVKNRRGMTVSCNLVYRICQLHISGWYSRKTAGILGTMDNEPTTDMIHSDRKSLTDLSEMVKSWDVSDDTDACTVTRHPSQGSSSSSSSSGGGGAAATTEARTLSVCNKFFRSIVSSLQPCFSTVNVDPYLRMCKVGEASGTACTAAMAYISMCKNNGVILQLPSPCIKCDMNGEEMIDRDIRQIDSTTVPRNLSTDIVFIVEAKDCNRNLRSQNKTESLIKTLEDELARANFVSNRYSVVVFGGDGVFEHPRQIIHNNEDFTGPNNIGQYFSNIVAGNGSRDVFGALAFTLKLRFRPGVSKTFILLPCSSCQPQHMTMDFSTISYAMLEQDATLHILMNNDFPLENNKNLLKKFFGMDSNLGFTRADGGKEGLQGETKIRQQVKVPRSMLGHCTPLALQTNGSIFTGKKLQNRKDESVKLFLTVFSRRVAQTARPADCHTCYCSPDQDGVGRIQCFLCDYPRYKAMPEMDPDTSLGEIEEEEDEEETPTTQAPRRVPAQDNQSRTETNGEDDEDFDTGNGGSEEEED